MATITRGADIAGVVSVANVATLTGVAIGTASQDRIVVLCCGGELNATPNSATIDYGLGAIAMTAGTLAQFSTTVVARLFWLNVPTGTTATFAITWSAATAVATTHYATYAMTAVNLTPTNIVNTSTDMDSTVPLTTGAITIVTNGGFLAVAVGAATSAKSWTNATVDINTTTANFGFTTATRTTALSATAILCTGSTNGEDGALASINIPSGSAVMPIAANATGQTGTFGPGVNKTLTADTATGQAGTFTLNPSVTLTAAPATGQFASFVPEVGVPLIAAPATGQFGTFTVTGGSVNYGFATFIPAMGGL